MPNKQNSLSRRTRCFIAMPFNDIQNKLYNEVYSPVVKKLGYLPIRADSIRSNRPIVEDIIQNLFESHFVIVDITDNNPNVFYELGLASAMQKQIILITSSAIQNIPFDIKHIRVISRSEKSSNWKNKLRNDLESTILTVIGQSNRPKLRARNSIENIFENVHSILKNANNLYHLNRSFELGILEWRMETEAIKASSINEGRLEILAKDKYPYLRYVFGSIVRNLKSEDVYYTLSKPSFWCEGKIGTNEFLLANLYALENKATIRRLILINNSRMKKDKEYRSQVEEMEKLLTNFNKKILKNNQIDSNNYEVRKLFFSEKRSVPDYFENAPFAIVSNPKANRYLSVQPLEVNKENRVSEPQLLIRFHKHNDAEIIDHLKQFKETWDESIPLR